MSVKLANRLLAVLLALALLVLGVLVLVEIVWVYAFGGSREVLLPYAAAADYFEGLAWTSRPTRVILIVLVVVGLLLLVAELRRSKPGLLSLASSTGPVTTGADRRALEKAAAAVATDVEGVSAARAKVSRRRISVAAESGLRDGSGLRERLDARMASWVDGLSLADPPALAVRVSQRRSR